MMNSKIGYKGINMDINSIHILRNFLKLKYGSSSSSAHLIYKVSGLDGFLIVKSYGHLLIAIVSIFSGKKMLKSLLKILLFKFEIINNLEFDIDSNIWYIPKPDTINILDVSSSKAYKIFYNPASLTYQHAQTVYMTLKDIENKLICDDIAFYDIGSYNIMETKFYRQSNILSDDDWKYYLKSNAISFIELYMSDYKFVDLKFIIKYIKSFYGSDKEIDDVLSIFLTDEFTDLLDRKVYVSITHHDLNKYNSILTKDGVKIIDWGGVKEFILYDFIKSFSLESIDNIMDKYKDWYDSHHIKSILNSFSSRANIHITDKDFFIYLMLCKVSILVKKKYNNTFYLEKL